jgi:hypothetical protein
MTTVYLNEALSSDIDFKAEAEAMITEKGFVAWATGHYVVVDKYTGKALKHGHDEFEALEYDAEDEEVQRMAPTYLSKVWADINSETHYD